MKRLTNRAREARGQALVEFAIAIIVFLVIVMAIFDLGRAIYLMNGTAQAAREIARAVSVHPCPSNLLACAQLGTSTDAIDVIATQQGLVPGLTVGAAPETQDVVNGIACVDSTDTTIADINCRPRDFIRVSVIAPFAPITPLVSMFGAHNFTSTSRIEKP